MCIKQYIHNTNNQNAKRDSIPTRTTHRSFSVIHGIRKLWRN